MHSCSCHAVLEAVPRVRSIAGWVGVCLPIFFVAANGPLGAQQRQAPQFTSLVGALQADWETTISLDIDRGWLGLTQSLRKASTTASLLHITGHPDDEHSGMLTLESRGRGTRTALVSVNRGEGGANALGPELFDALGAIRTEELLLAGRWYGLDDLYFTTAVDYGYSKTLEEAYRSWDREAVLEDLVRIIRMNRPLVIVSRWHGSPRDGHGHHQAAGDLAVEAAAAAGDPNRFPAQVKAGLRPWKALRVFRGGVREGEHAQVLIDAAEYAPQFGQTYQDVASAGLSLQRSQTSGRMRPSGRATYAYELMSGPSLPDTVANSFFEGFDTSLQGLPSLLNEPASQDLLDILVTVDEALRRAQSSALEAGPATSTALIDALRALGRVQQPGLSVADGSEVSRVLDAKRRQVERALAIAMGIELTATTRVGDVSPTRVAAGDVFEVDVRLAIQAEPEGLLQATEVTVEAPAGWIVARVPEVSSSFRVTVSPHALPTTQYFDRPDIRLSQYVVHDSAALGRPWAPPPLHAIATLRLDEFESITVRSAVRGSEAMLPFGVRRYELSVVPPVLLELPRMHVTGGDHQDQPFDVPLAVRQGGLSPVSGTLQVELPEGWTLESPDPLRFSLDTPSESQFFNLRVTPPPSSQQKMTLSIEAVLGRGGVMSRFGAGEQAVRYPDLQPRYLGVPATLERVVVDATAPADLRVGYVMGVGDAIPEGLRALGIGVDLLDAEYVESGNLSIYDALFIGTRAYAVRPELTIHNERLLSYARTGGHLVVLYQTSEYDAARLAPHNVVLPRNAEETSEEDAAVVLLASVHSQVMWPNMIVTSDFENWVEQRGSKFFSEWGPEFTPLLETADEGQEPQRGVWLTADLGEGAYTYCALALHRQTPYGVEGAFKILANLASYSRRP